MTWKNHRESRSVGAMENSNVSLHHQNVDQYYSLLLFLYNTKIVCNRFITKIENLNNNVILLLLCLYDVYSSALC